MVLLAGKLAFSPEFEKAKWELQAAREKYTSLVEHYTHLISVVGPNLETDYMLKLGKKEYELFACQIEILRLKREISLFQAARNRGENIPEKQVKDIIAAEFAEYQAKLREQQQKLEVAERRFSARPFTQEETKAFKKLYHDLVRQLHPDLNPNLPHGAAVLWERIQDAYKCNDWDELFLLADMVHERLSGKEDYVESLDSLSLLRQELEKIRQKTADLEQQIAETGTRIPFSYEALLDYPAEFKRKRQEFNGQILLCQAHIAELEKIRAEFQS
ncbi:MAG: J domain-containing protein [Lentisphaeria bacterium]|nr:J domain-containing protein [Lentisphaeria bacterium]